jgi:hypothetical protein
MTALCNWLGRYQSLESRNLNLEHGGSKFHRNVRIASYYNTVPQSERPQQRREQEV